MVFFTASACFFSVILHATLYIPNIAQTFGSGIGYSSGYTSAGVMVIPELSTYPSVPFLDLNGYRLSNQKGSALSVGIGNRFPYSSLVMGGNLYYDYFNTKRGSFNQLGLGIEIFTPRYLFRLNGYQPVGVKKGRYKRTIFDHYYDGYVMVKKETICVLSGFDMEFDFLAISIGSFRLFAGVGSYYFKESRFNQSTFGGQFRLSANLMKYFSTEVLVTSDRLFGTLVSGQILITIPFGSNPEGQSARLWQPVQRRPFMASRKQCCWDTNF